VSPSAILTTLPTRVSAIHKVDNRRVVANTKAGKVKCNLFFLMMVRITDMFEKHLNESNKTYMEHFAFAFKAGFILLWAGITSIIHAFIPSLFAFTSRDIVVHLANESRKQQEKFQK
jgi:hypothetical protein